MFSMLKLYKIHLNFHTQQQQRRNLRVPDRKMHHSNNQSSKTSVYASHANAYRPSVQTSNQGLSMQLKHQKNYASPQQQWQQKRCKYCYKQFTKLSSLKKHQMLHETADGRPSLHLTPEVDLVDVRNRSLSLSSNEYPLINKPSSSINKQGTLTLTPSLLSNLNKLANLSSSDSRDGKKPAILININTNDSSAKDDSAAKPQELPVGSSASGLMISSVSSVDKNFYEQPDMHGSGKPTVLIQNGKKSVSLADLQCPICKKIVSQPFSLKIHLRTHTMER
jgi:Zinc finger, C2H2 type